MEQNDDKPMNKEGGQTPPALNIDNSLLAQQAALMADDSQSNQEKEGEEDKGRGGRGGKGGGGGPRLPPSTMKDVLAGWQYLDLADAVARVAEFFSEVPARASANLSIAWAGAKKHGYALVNHFISAGQDIAHLMRSRDAGLIKRLGNYGVRARKAGKTTTIQPNMEPNLG